MQHLPIQDLNRRVARQVACTTCYQRPAGSEAWGPEVVRPCEGACPLFAYLPALARVAADVGEAPGDWETAVKQQICAGCHLRPTAGDFCADYTARACPLSRYAGGVIDALQRAERVEYRSTPRPTS